MAGIGFELRRLQRHDTLLGTVRAYSASGLIASGPWIISILSIAVLSVLLRSIAADGDRQLVLSSVTHIYAFMLILTGAPSLILTRHAADAFSEDRPGKVLPGYLAVLTGVMAAAALGAGAFFYFGVPSSPAFQWAGTALAVLVAAIFITANYLGTLKHYGSILASFFSGYVLSCILAFELTRRYPGEPALALWGFVLGHLLLFLMLFAALYRELPAGSRSVDLSSLRHFRRFPALALAGLLYNAGLWIDKLLFWWFSPGSVQVRGAMFSAPDYDVAVYLSVLSIVPGMAVFCLKLETGFAENFTRYFKQLNGGSSLGTLNATKAEINRALSDGLGLLTRVQGVTTLVLLVFADSLTGFLNLGAFELGVLRVTLVGSFFLVLFLSFLTVLFYFDDRRGALMGTVTFFGVNGLVTLATLLSGHAYYGVGYVAAAGLAFAVTAFRANQLLVNLEFRIFTRPAARGAS
ncbi:MAG: exopolysaccharide Pel transporter PelG [Akkermansiaceae bacterium]|nr:exopolysaccharide Pel transporter PelG [Akkermansiaceae bacterium]